MAFLKEKLNAFLDQPLEKKRSDHRLKKVDSNVDPRSWVLDEELKRQQFLNVVNQTGDGGSGEGGEEGSEEGEQPTAALLPREKHLQLEEKIKILEEEKDFLRNVIADKENEIEQLIHRIEIMSEVKDSGLGLEETVNLKKQLNDMKNQYLAKDKELKKTKYMLNKAEGMLQNLETLMQSTGEDPGKQKSQLDNIMRGMQAGLQDEVKSLHVQVKKLEDELKDSKDENLSLKKELEALASGDDNELNKVILRLRNEVDNIKSSKDLENNELKDIIASKDEELKRIKDLLNLQKSQPTEDSNLLKSSHHSNMNSLQDALAQRDGEIKALKYELEDEKKKNKALKDQVEELASIDESGLKNKILELTAELDDSKEKELVRKKTVFGKAELKFAEPLRTDVDQLKEIQDLLSKEQNQNEKLKKELENANYKYNQLVSADDNELKILLSDANNKIDKLKTDQKHKDQVIESLKAELALKEKLEPGDLKVKDDKEANRHGLEEENMNLKKENEQLHKQIDELKRETVKSTDELPKQLNPVGLENRDEKNKVKPEILELPQEDNKNVTFTSGDVSGKLLNKINQLTAENEGLKDENESLKKVLKDKENEAIQSLSVSPDTYQTGPDKSNSSVLRKENDDLKKEKENLNKELELLKQRNNQLENVLNKLDAEGKLEATVVGADKSKLEYQSHLPETPSGSNQAVNDLSRKLIQLEDENDKFKKSFIEEKEKCNENLSNKDKTIELLETETKMLKDKNITLSGEIMKLKRSAPVLSSTEEGTQQKDKKDTEQKLLKETESEILSDNKSQDVLKLLNDNKYLNSVNNKLIKDIEKLKDELNNIKPDSKEKQSLDTHATKESDLIAENRQLKDKISSLEKKINDALTNETLAKKDYKYDADPIEQDYNKLLEEHKSLKTNFKALENEVKDLKSKVTDAEPKETNKKDKSIKPSEAGTHTKDESKLLQENNKLKENVKVLENEIKNLKSIIADTSTQDTGKQEINLKPDKERGAKDDSKILGENNKLKESVRALENEIKDLKSKIAATVGKDTDNKETYMKPDTERSAKDDNKLVEENNKLKEHVMALENDVKDLKLKIAAIKGQDTDKKDMDKDDNKVLEENRKFKDKIKLLEDELLYLKSKGMYKEDKTKLADIEKDTKDDIFEDHMDYEQLLAENAKLKHKLKAQENEIKNMKPSIVDKKEKTELKLKNEDKEPISDASSIKNNELLKENKKLQSKIKSLEDNINDLKLQITDKKEKPNLGTKQKIEDSKFQDEKSKLSKANELLNSNLKGLKKQIEDETVKNKDLQEENKKLTELITAAEEAGGIKDNDIIKMYKENNDKLKKDNATQKSRIVVLEKELDQLKGHHEKEVQPRSKQAEENIIEGKALTKETKTSPSGKEKLLDKLPLDQTNKNREITQPISDDKSKPERTLDKSQVMAVKKNMDVKNKHESVLGMKEETKNSVKASSSKEKGENIISKDVTQPPIDKAVKLGKIKEIPQSDSENLNIEVRSQPVVDVDGPGTKIKGKPLPDIEKKKEDKRKDKRKFELSEKEEDDKNNLPDQININVDEKRGKTQDSQPILHEQKGKPTADLGKKKEVNRDADIPKTGDEGKHKTLTKPDTKSMSPVDDLEKSKVGPKTPLTKEEEISKPKKRDKEEATKKKLERPARSVSPTLFFEKDNARPKSPATATEDGENLKAKIDKDKVQFDVYEKEKSLSERKSLESEGKIKLPIKEDKEKVLPRKNQKLKAGQHEEKKDVYYGIKPETITIIGDYDEDKEEGHVEGKMKEMRNEMPKEKVPFREKEIDETETTDLKKKRHGKETVDSEGKPTSKKKRVKDDQDDLSTTFNVGGKVGKIVLAKELTVDEDDNIPTEFDVQDRGIGDKGYDNLLNELKKKLYEAEKLIYNLKKENSKLKLEVQDLKIASPLKDDQTGKYQDFLKHVDESTTKLNRILGKAIRNGLRSLYLNELGFVHDSLNNRMADLKGNPSTPSQASTEDLENIINTLNKRMTSLMQRLDMYRQLSSDQGQKISDYSQKVQELITVIGLKDMKIETLQYDSNLLRNLLSYEKDKSKKSEDMLRSVLENCKCTKKWVLQQNYSSLR